MRLHTQTINSLNSQPDSPASTMWVTLIDAITVVYYLLHLPISVFIDSQLILGEAFAPKWAVAALEDHIQSSRDPMLEDPEIWFLALIVFEIVFQVPFFICALYCYFTRSATIRIPSLLYAAQTCTTVVPILATIVAPLLEGEPVEYDVGQMLKTYVPFFLIPFFIGVRWIVCEDPPFSTVKKSSKQGKDA